MPVPHAEMLLERAQKGERLNSRDRRHCISYLMATDAIRTNVEMAKLFQVTEQVIRNDKKVIREERAKLIKEDDVALVIADISLNFERQIRDLEKSKTKATIGSRTYLQHCKSIFELELARVKALQDLGYYPKNLGTITETRFEFHAEVGKDGSVVTRKVTEFDKPKDETPIEEAEFEDVKPAQLPAAPAALEVPLEAELQPASLQSGDGPAIQTVPG